MTYGEYWNASPRLAAQYRKAHQLKQEEKSRDAWLQGIYIQKAFGVVLGNAFAKKGSKKERYFEEPIRVTPKSKREIEAEAAKERKKITENLRLMAEAQKRRKKETEGNNG